MAAYLLDHKSFSSVPPTTFVEVVHKSLKYVPFTGLDVSSEFYYDVMSSIILPPNNNLDESKIITKNSSALTISQSNPGNNSTFLGQDRPALRIAQETQIGMKFGSL